MDHRDAVLSVAPVFDTPTVPASQGITGTSVVKITLTASGDLSNAAIWNSSGNLVLDNAALHVARISKYQPEVRNCADVGGSYLIDVGFE